MTWDIISTIINLLLGGGFIVTLVTLKSQKKKAETQAEKGELDNIEQATRILMANIVEPLKKELSAVRRELSKFRRAIEKINSCPYDINNCPVRRELQKQESNCGNRDEDCNGAGC
jgi:hypothetical protein